MLQVMGQTHYFDCQHIHTISSAVATSSFWMRPKSISILLLVYFFLLNAVISLKTKITTEVYTTKWMGFLRILLTYKMIPVPGIIYLCPCDCIFTLKVRVFWKSLNFGKNIPNTKRFSSVTVTFISVCIFTSLFTPRVFNI